MKGPTKRAACYASATQYHADQLAGIFRRGHRYLSVRLSVGECATNQPAEFRRVVLVALAIAVVVNLILAGWSIFRRNKIEKAAGRFLYRPQLSFWMERMTACIMITINLIILAVSCYFFLPTLRTIVTATPNFNSPATYCVAGTLLSSLTISLFQPVILLWWNLSPASLEIREHGLIYGAFKFLRWGEIGGYQIKEGKHAWRLDIGQRHQPLIGHADVDDVRALLNAYGLKERGRRDRAARRMEKRGESKS